MAEDDGKIFEAYIDIGARPEGAYAVIDGMKGKIKAALGDIQGPAIKPRFDFNEQQIRNGMASAMRAMRDEANKFNISDEINRRLFGSPSTPSKDAELGDIQGPAIKARFDKQESLVRTRMAELIRIEREHTQQLKIEVEARNRLLDPNAEAKLGELHGPSNRPEFALGEIHGPAVNPRFGERAQAIRNAMAVQIRSMRDQAKAASIEDAASERLFGPKPAEDISKAGGAAKAAAQEVGGLKGELLKLRDEFGRGSAAGMFAQLLRGAGPALAIGIGLSELASMATAAGKVSDELRRGKVDAAGAVVEFGKSIPILGSIVTIGQVIREEMTGEKLEMERINDDIETANKLLSLQVEILSLAREETIKLAQAHLAVSNAQRLASATTPAQIRDAKVANDDATRQLKLEQEKEAFRIKRMAQEKSEVEELTARGQKAFEAAAPSAMERAASRIDKILGGGSASDDFFKGRQGDAAAAAKAGIGPAQSKAAADIAIENARLEKIANEEKKNALELWRAEIAQEVSNINEQAAEVAMNPLAAARSKAKFQGTAGMGVAEATGKLLGAQLIESVKTPFQVFEKNLNYWRGLLAAGDINQQTFLRLQSKAFESIQSTFSRSDIDSAARSGIASQFAVALMMPAVNRINGGLTPVGIESDKMVVANTAAIQQLTAAIVNSNPLGGGARYR